MYSIKVQLSIQLMRGLEVEKLPNVEMLVGKFERDQSGRG